MNIIQALILGIIQGLTEFIPVSSTAHLLIAQQLLGIQATNPEQANFMFAFNVLVQLGTLVSLFVFFWADLYKLAAAMLTALRRKEPFGDPQALLGWYILLATAPALVVGFFLRDLVEQLFGMPLIEAMIRLAFTAVLLVAAEQLGKRSRKLEALTWQDALWIGGAQILSVFPGASRSGSTIAGGMTRNLERPAAARFAFLMSIPIMLAAGGYQALELVTMPGLLAYLPAILVGFVAAAVVGYLAIRWLLNFLARQPLYIFSIYCGALALVMLVLNLVAK